jgi:hypothetical protein
MSKSLIPDVDISFYNQASIFLERALRSFGISSLSGLRQISNELPTLIPPILINDFRRVSIEEKEALSNAFYGRYGVAYFIVMNPDSEASFGHPLIALSRQLTDVLPLSYPITHPAEIEPLAEALFGPPDGTLKVFQRADQDNSQEMKELHMHQDGIGSAGTIVTIALYCESAPLWGGFTCFQNALRLVLELARQDIEAFEALFHPMAITVIRRQGDNALKVTGPVLYLNAQGDPQIFLRAEGGDYDMFWYKNEALLRARRFLSTYLKPFSFGTGFVQFSAQGQGCFIHNRIVLHGRTRFMDGPCQRRVLARKWFADTAENATVKRVPGLKILNDYASLRPDLFGEEVLQGIWRYNNGEGCNVRLHDKQLSFQL